MSFALNRTVFDLFGHYLIVIFVVFSWKMLIADQKPANLKNAKMSDNLSFAWSKTLLILVNLTEGTHQRLEPFTRFTPLTR